MNRIDPYLKQMQWASLPEIVEWGDSGRSGRGFREYDECRRSPFCSSQPAYMEYDEKIVMLCRLCLTGFLVSVD